MSVTITRTVIATIILMGAWVGVGIEDTKTSEFANETIDVVCHCYSFDDYRE